MIITRPTLLVDEAKCRQHIQQMVEKAHAAGVVFRPHFKTHQSHAIGNWFRALGVTKITTASVSMAEYFANDGWDDITIAFPLNYLAFENINALAKKVTLNLCAVNVEAVQHLAEKLTHSISIYIEIDTGYGRTGIDATDYTAIDAIISVINSASKMTFEGFVSHAGHSYKCRNASAIEEVHATTVNKIKALAVRYKTQFPELICSVGDTPTCSVMDSFDGVDEIRPGNFVFYDVTQSEIGACTLDDVAVVVACPIVAIHKNKSELVVHGGAVHLSKDSIILPDGKLIFGRLAKLSDTGWEILPASYFVKSISQEHGIITIPEDSIPNFSIGDVIGIVPVHSCLAADCMGGYQTLSGKKLDHMKGAK